MEETHVRRAGRHYTVLVVEDDPQVRELVIDRLSIAGYNVLTAGDGPEALRILHERWVDLLFTDVVMPGMSGFELARQARRIRPSIRVVYATGFADTAPDRDLPRLGALLEKPYAAQQLLAEIEHALGSA